MSDALTPNISTTLTQSQNGIADKIMASAKNARDMEKINKTAEEFEAVFLSEMLKPMFEGTEAPAPFNGGKGEEVFQGFMLQEYGKMIAKDHSIGVADMVKAEMIRMQEAQQALAQEQTAGQEQRPLNPKIQPLTTVQ